AHHHHHHHHHDNDDHHNHNHHNHNDAHDDDVVPEGAVPARPDSDPGARAASAFASALPVCALPERALPERALPVAECALRAAAARRCLLACPPTVAGQQVGYGFATYEFADAAVGNRDQRRTPDHVVVGRHAVVVGPGTGHREQVPGVYVCRKVDVARDLIAGLAVPTDDGDRFRRANRMAICQGHRVLRAVERHPGVVAHAAVNSDERAPTWLALDG